MNTLTDEELDKIEERFGDPPTAAVTFDECMKLLRAARRHNEDQWISVSEKLPEPYDDVLVSGKGYERSRIACHTGNGWRWQYNSRDLYHVTHWKPFPKNYDSV